jgi:hypothetical protein
MVSCIANSLEKPGFCYLLAGIASEKSLASGLVLRLRYIFVEEYNMSITEQDRQYLQLLSIFHYVVGGLTALIGCFPIFHLTIGLSMLFGGFMTADMEGVVFSTLFGLLFTLIPLLIILFFWGLAAATAVSGYFIQTRQRRIFSIVIAAINCAMFPFGTVLGVFTIIVLARPSVVALYETTPAWQDEEE